MATLRCFSAFPRLGAAASVAGAVLLPFLLACGTDDEGDVESSTSPVQQTPSTPPAPAARTPSNPPASEAPGAAARTPAPANPPAQPPAANAPAASAPAAPAQTFTACTRSETTYGRNCDLLYVSMKQTSPARCVQLTIDNCGEYGRDGLPVDVPMPWRLDSGTVGTNPNQCELGVFYTSSSVARTASGTIEFQNAARLPTDLELDVTLEMSSAAADAVDVVTTGPITPTVCDD